LPVHAETNPDGYRNGPTASNSYPNPNTHADANANDGHTNTHPNTHPDAGSWPDEPQVRSFETCHDDQLQGPVG
jgi:hypothetical protein